MRCFMYSGLLMTISGQKYHHHTKYRCPCPKTVLLHLCTSFFRITLSISFQYFVLSFFKGSTYQEYILDKQNASRFVNLCNKCIFCHSFLSYANINNMVLQFHTNYLPMLELFGIAESQLTKLYESYDITRTIESETSVKDAAFSHLKPIDTIACGD